MSAETAADLRAALALIPDASRWLQGRARRVDADGTVRRCMLGAVHEAAPGCFWACRAALWRAIGGGRSLSSWNDSHTYAEVRAVFEKAIAAEEASS